jgi:hypothetical protein
VLRLEADLLLQLSIHRCLWPLTTLYAALRKLPRVLTHPLTPENFVFGITQNDSDVRAITISIYHGHPTKLKQYVDHFSTNCRLKKPH